MAAYRVFRLHSADEDAVSYLTSYGLMAHETHTRRRLNSPGGSTLQCGKVCCAYRHLFHQKLEINMHHLHGAMQYRQAQLRYFYENLFR